MRARLAVLVAAAVAVALVGVAPASAGFPRDWSAAPVAPRPVATGQLAGVSCVDGGGCVAAGAAADRAGRLHTLVESTGATTWRRRASAEPAGSTDSALHAISCAAKTFCVAVGTSWFRRTPRTLIEANASGSWRLSDDDVADAGASDLWGVSCAARDFCVAVGRHATSSGVVALIEQWDGQAWSRVEAPGTGHRFTELLAVDCPAPGVCQAVGTTGSAATDRPGSAAAVIETLSAGVWTQQQLAEGASTEALRGVSCASATSCVAVGDADGAGRLATFDGATWTVTEGVAVPRLNAVSCARAAGCAVVGAAGYVARFDGAALAAEASPTAAELAGVSCVAGACSAVGGTTVPVTLAYDGAWTSTTAARPVGGASGQLDALDCPTSTACRAMGSYLAPDGSRLALAENWDGTSWSSAPITSPPSARAVDVAAVSCADPAFCFAAGTVTAADGPHPLLERWDGAAWRPVTAGAGAAPLAGIGCASRVFCLAVTADGAVIRWDGATWSAGPSLLGAGLAVNSLDCVTDTFCVAVGTAGGAALYERFDGAAWTLQDNSRPAGVTELFHVHCLSTTLCAAGGAAPTAGYLVIWNGKHWRTAIHRSARGPITTAACSSPTYCVAVGATAILAGTPFKQHYDSAASPTGALAPAQARDVACLATQQCWAVGVAVTARGAVPFAETKV